MDEHKISGLFEQIHPAPELKQKILNRMETDEMKIKKPYKKIAALAACAAVISATTLLAAASPQVRQALGQMISYFSSDQAQDISSVNALAKYNKPVDLSCTKDGRTLTVDNIAIDENFLHVFYTLHSEDLIETTDASPWAAQFASPFFSYQIDGVPLAFSNHNETTAYFVDEHTIKGAAKVNLSQTELPAQFQLEIFTESLLGKRALTKLESKQLYTDSASIPALMEKCWRVSVLVDRSDVKTESTVYSPNAQVKLGGEENATVKKVVFSPFGSQLVLHTPRSLSAFALYDDKGTCLDVLNTDLREGENGAENTYEFLKADKNTKAITFVPISWKPLDAPLPEITNNMGTYPLTFQTSEYGSVIVTDLRILDNRLEIDYYKDGFVEFDPHFQIKNQEGNDVNPFQNQIIQTHRETNSYTVIYAADTNQVLTDAEKQALASAGQISVFSNAGVVLDFDHATRIPLE